MTKAKPHTGHETHLCALVEDMGLTEKMKPMIKNPKFVCTCCARAANKAEYICEPERL